MLTWKYSLPAFLVPFAFTLDPRGLGLLLAGSWTDIVMSSVTAAVGVGGLAMGFGGWAIGTASKPARAVAILGGLLLFHPAPAADIAGLFCLVGALALARRRVSVIV